MFKFKKSNKAKKGGNTEKGQAGALQPNRTQYMHVPKNAASNSVSNTHQVYQGVNISQSEQRLAKPRNDLTAKNSLRSRPAAHDAAHLASSFRPVPAKQTQLLQEQGQSDNGSVLKTDADASSLFTSQMQNHINAAQRRSMLHNASNAGSNVLGNLKANNAIAKHARFTPQHSADSGYGSTEVPFIAQPRGSSSNNGPVVDPSSPHLPHPDADGLPELSLSEELAREPAFSERSFEDNAADSNKSKSTQRSNHTNGYLGLLSRDEVPDSKATKPAHVAMDSTPKQARFDRIQPVQEMALEFTDSNGQTRSRPSLIQSQHLSQSNDASNTAASFVRLDTDDASRPGPRTPGNHQPRFAQSEEQIDGEPRAVFMLPRDSASPHEKLASRWPQISAPGGVSPLSKSGSYQVNFPWSHEEHKSDITLEPQPRQASDSFEPSGADDVLNNGRQFMQQLPAAGRHTAQERIHSPPKVPKGTTGLNHPNQEVSALSHLRLEADRDPALFDSPATAVEAARSTFPPPVGHNKTPYLIHQFSSPPQSQLRSLEQTIPGSQHSNLPPMSILAGLKVNKRGKILDEEGEPIGELYEGDIMDCVRQRANGFGEVVDDYGKVVGRVRPSQRSLEPSIIRTPTSAQAVSLQQQTYHQPKPEPPDRHTTKSSRPASSSSHRNYVSPQQQLTYRGPGEPVLAEELRTHIATSGQPSLVSVVKPRDMPEGMTHVELDATEPTQHSVTNDDDSETFMIDQSDIFLPPPHVPAKSPSRPMSPNTSLQNCTRHSFYPQAVQISQADLDKEAKHTSTPPVQRPMWAAAQALDPDIPNGTFPLQPPQLEAQDVVQPVEQTETQPAAYGELQSRSQTTQQALLEPVHQPFGNETQRHITRVQPSPSTSPKSPERQEQQVAPSDSEAASPAMELASNQSLQDLNGSLSSPIATSMSTNGPLTSTAHNVAFISSKGENPAADGPYPNTHLPLPRTAGAKPPPLPSFPRQAFTGSVQGAGHHAPLNTLQSSSIVSPRAQAQISPGALGFKPGMTARNSFNQPLRRSPLSSHGRNLSTISASDKGEADDDNTAETSPPDSDGGSVRNKVDEAQIGIARGMHSRQPSGKSVTTMHSMASVGSKPRTYFTHAGRVTVEPGQPTPSQQQATEGPKSGPGDTAAGGIDAASIKKKSRFSLGLAKKNQAVSAH